MTIEIRTKPLANGNESIYLDYYDKGERWYEYLKLYITPEVDVNSKRLNRNAMDRAVAIKAERILHIEKEEKQTEANLPARLFTEYMDGYLANIEGSSSHFRNVQSLINIIKAYLKQIRKPNMLLSKVNKIFYKGLLSFMKYTYMNTKDKNNPKTLSVNTLLLHQTSLNTMLNHAVREGLMLENPFYQLDARDRISKSDSNRVFLTKEEVQRLEAVQKGSLLTKQAFLFCCFTGLRHSDVSALKWGDIKYTGTGLSIMLSQMQKTKRSLYVPLSKKALEWMPARGNNDDFMPVFAVPVLSSCDRSLKYLAKYAEIEKTVGFHTSRHTFATLSLAAGGDLYTVSKLLGHTNIKSTQIYADVLLETKIDAVCQVDKIFG